MSQVVCLYETEAAQIPELAHCSVVPTTKTNFIQLLEIFQAGQLRAPVFIAIYKRCLHCPLKMYCGTDKVAFLLNVPVLGQRFEINYVWISYSGQALR
jgi:hypothetical protein